MDCGSALLNSGRPVMKHWSVVAPSEKLNKFEFEYIVCYQLMRKMIRIDQKYCTFLQNGHRLKSFSLCWQLIGNLVIDKWILRKKNSIIRISQFLDFSPNSVFFNMKYIFTDLEFFGIIFMMHSEKFRVKNNIYSQKNTTVFIGVEKFHSSFNIMVISD